MNNKKFLILLEGADGIGKTTTLKFLECSLKKKGIKVIMSKEPNNSLCKLKIRDILLNSKEKLNTMTELLLFLIDRNLNKELKLKKSLKEIKANQFEIILCDRSFYSSFVYQGKIGGFFFDTIYKLHELTNSFVNYDLTFFIDINKKEDFEIVDKRREFQKDRIESKINLKWKEISKYYIEVFEYFKKKNPSLKINTIKWDCKSKIMASKIEKIVLSVLNSNEN